MKYHIGCDAHKHFSMFAVLNDEGHLHQRTRINHLPGAIKNYLSQFPEGTPVAIESVGNWYWIIDEIEESGCVPKMAHAAKAKVMMGNVNKTDKLDAVGLATLERLGSLPTVWLAPGDLRDERDLPRTRMAISKIRTALKNRIHSTLAKYNLSLDTDSDIFAPKWRNQLLYAFQALPPETTRCMEQELELLDYVQAHIHRLEERILERIELSETIQLVKSLPAVGKILSIVIEREVGSIDRFPSSHHFASYAGTTPKIKGSAGKYRYGRMRKQSNNYLKWAFIEAANVVVRQRNHPNWRNKHVSRLYERTRRRKGHFVAVGTVARYLSEAAYWVLKKGEPYKEPEPKAVSSKQGRARG
jgi:transposase